MAVDNPRRGVHRLPAPPAALRGRATIASVAAGALAAAGQTLATLGPAEDQAGIQLASGAVISSADDATRHAAGARGFGSSEFDSALPIDDMGDMLDIQSLTKALDLGQELSRRGTNAAGMPFVLFDGLKFFRPCAGILTSSFGARWGTTHRGVDIANRLGTPIYAVSDGTVIESGPTPGYGMWVRILHSGGWTSVYGHINRSMVQAGQAVKAGDKIAEMGSRGYSTGPHLHLEVWDPAGNKVNPISWLARRGMRL